MATQTTDYPLTKFYFDVNWGSGEMNFQEVTGLEMTREKAEYRGGMDKSFVKRQIPAMKTFGELTLKRGSFAGDNDFYDWWNGTSKDAPGDGMPALRDLTINLKNAAGSSVMTWKVAKAFPTKVTSTDLNAQNNEVALETLVLAHEGFTLETKK